MTRSNSYPLPTNINECYYCGYVHEGEVEWEMTYDPMTNQTKYFCQKCGGEGRTNAK